MLYLQASRKKVSIQLEFLNLRGTEILLSFLAICIFRKFDPYTCSYKPPNALHIILQQAVCVCCFFWALNYRYHTIPLIEFTNITIFTGSWEEWQIHNVSSMFRAAVPSSHFFELVLLVLRPIDVITKSMTRKRNASLHVLGSWWLFVTFTSYTTQNCLEFCPNGEHDMSLDWFNY